MKRTDTAESELDNVLRSLSPLEMKAFPFMLKISSVQELVSASGMDFVSAMRALEFFSNKKLVTLETRNTTFVVLGKNGKRYLEKGLPEKQLLKACKDRPVTRGILVKQGMEHDEIAASIGTLKKKAAIEISKDKDITFTITDLGKKLLLKESLEEQFMKKLPLKEADIKDELKYGFDQLISRKDIIKKIEQKDTIVVVTDLGKKIFAKKQATGLIERVTQKMLKTGSWKGKEFRRFDISSPVPAVVKGRRHFVKEAEDYARSIWLEMGFSEMTGPIVNTSFWNFDALFTAQDHPVRDLQDTFYLENPELGQLPAEKTVKAVKQAHEDGGDTGSKGWRYAWKKEEAQKNVLRTHTTVLSALTIAALKKDDLPVKYFSLGRCFRNEAVDWSHLFEFNQTEGIVVGEGVNFTHLLGYLKQFFRKMGFPQARFRPAHFPYTEPSVEIDVYHPVHKKWMELGGAGLFRPELIVPLLGKEIPVLAWGPGFDRIIMDYYKLKDVRDLYKNDLSQTRTMKEWMR